MIPMTGDGFATSVVMEGGGTSTSTIGGAIQQTTSDDIYGQVSVNRIGTVIVEFVLHYIDPDNPTKYKYKHLYSVPVEVKDESWLNQ
jgi:hypothetical protein